jgi:hypothetical protein
MKFFLLLLTILSLVSFSPDVSAQVNKQSLPEGIGITAGYWNTRFQSGSVISLDLHRFGLDLALHQEFVKGMQVHATSIVAGHSNKTDRWLTFARAGVLFDWEKALPGVTAETGLSWRMHEDFAFSFTLHGDLTKTGLIAGSRLGIQTHL